ncbi:MAG: N-acetylmuramoyl-L-alanine amidase [Holophagae bacterium]|nr:N-acetylmuramoyl-L-alanine amidase [Holophagae bacterium]
MTLLKKLVLVFAFLLLTPFGIAQEIVQDLPPAETETATLDFSIIVNGRVRPLQTVMEDTIPYFLLSSVFKALSPNVITVNMTDSTHAELIISEEEVFNLNLKSGVIKEKEGDKTLSADVIWKKHKPYIRFDFFTRALPVILNKEVSFDSTTNTFFLGKHAEIRLNYKIKVTPQYSVLSLLFPARARYLMEEDKEAKTVRIVINSQFRKPAADFLTLSNDFFSVLDYKLEPSRTTITMSLTDKVQTVSKAFDRNFNRLRVYFYSPEFYNPVTDTLNQALPIYKPTSSTVHKVIIDPGHGGQDEGAIGQKGIIEKDITLAIAYKLAATLKHRGYEVIMTRYSDVFVPLSDRTGIANTNDGNIFISIHTNASTRKASGAETYYLSLKGTQTVSDTVAFENRQLSKGKETDHPKKNDLLFILWDMAQTEYLKDSSLLAEQIQSAMNDLTGIRNRGVKQANLVVLRGLNMPGVLVEVAFISNPSEEARLVQNGFQERTAAAIADSIDRYKKLQEERMKSALETPATTETSQ